MNFVSSLRIRLQKAPEQKGRGVRVGIDSISSQKPTGKVSDALCLRDPPCSVEVRAGQRAEVGCGIAGTPPITAIWLRDSKQLVSSPRVRVEAREREVRLVIEEVQAADAGVYTLVVTNHSGSLQQPIRLSVTDRPQPPAGHPCVSELIGGSLCLSWSGPCYDGGCAVRGYTVEARRVGGPEWGPLVTDCGSTSYCVRGLEPGDYIFRIRAVNSCGSSDPGSETPPISLRAETTPLSANPGTLSTSLRPETKPLGRQQTPGTGARGDGEEEGEYHHVVINRSQKVTDVYQQLERLGVGKFGQVYKLLERASGRLCAGKYYKARSAKDKQLARNEIHIMNSLHHPRLVQCMAAFETSTEIVMVMEYVAGGELFERLVDKDEELTEQTCCWYVQQMLEGLQFMHSSGVVHLDLKPENVVCVSPTCTGIKIIDFGLAQRLDPSAPVKVLCGTPEFVAPEVINYEAVQFNTDTWSIGVISYILLSGLSPFLGDTDDETLANVTAARWEFDEEAFEEISEDAKDFISSLLQRDWRRRLSSEGCLSHRWLNSRRRGVTKTLSKERMKQFLAKRKWQKTGRALLALKRLTLRGPRKPNTQRPRSPPPHNELSREPEVLSAADQQLQTEPSFSKVLGDLEELEGSAVCLQCHIQGTPEPEVMWYKDGQAVSVSRRVRIEYEEDGSCSLIIANASPADSGQYSCRATNSLGVCRCSASLTVLSLIAIQRR
ncbi:myosin light chain kinase, smooth muscle isoform X2 [Callorhinchus milii]|uniref:myosin light chain kinase, smooth muscle isoform X2 n=1 Tax=Callorhinchus milii TaxID=7868 RepID=UPI001C3F76E5|nr:myosin light chain kinase, smooth muscle isoform X2 [Callorhinchus milii]